MPMLHIDLLGLAQPLHTIEIWAFFVWGLPNPTHCLEIEIPALGN
jgi:hypothetical protein